MGLQHEIKVNFSAITVAVNTENGAPPALDGFQFSFVRTVPVPTCGVRGCHDPEHAPKDKVDWKATGLGDLPPLSALTNAVVEKQYKARYDRNATEETLKYLCAVFATMRDVFGIPQPEEPKAEEAK